MKQVRTPRMRQIHLDFHTSGDIQDIGRDFNAEEFGRMLEESHVDGITLFSRCHHGYLYYPSKFAPERIHPYLQHSDLLGEQVTACKRRDIAVCIYQPLQWDKFTADEHQEWLVVDAQGKIAGNGPYEAGFYNQLCLNTPYVDWVIGQAEEAVSMYRPHGLFFDIINNVDCSCRTCKSAMVREGFDPSDRTQRIAYRNQVVDRAMQRISDAMRALDPQLTIFYNHSHVRFTHRTGIGNFTHLELESLPSGGWGYWDYPVTVRYARTLGVPTVGMTGKFHTSWGDFHSLKTKASLEFECYRNLALGSGCSIGDQLHPWGELNKRSYALIGDVYREVHSKEPWCVNAEPVVEIGVFHPDGFDISTGHGLHPAVMGATRMLQELSYQFDIIDPYTDFSKYRVLVVPDQCQLDDDAVTKLRSYVASGGFVLSSAWGAVDAKSGKHWLEEGLHIAGPAEYEPDFIVAPFVPSFDDEQFVMYNRGVCIDSHDGLEILAWACKPAFNRTWEHFCSHQHAPSLGERVYPAIVSSATVIHFMHPVFTTYAMQDAPWCKTLVQACLSRFITDPVAGHCGPSSLVVLVNRQELEHRYVVHLLHYIPERRGLQFDVVHDVIPLYEVKIKLNLGSAVSQARIVPGGEKLELHEGNDGSVSCIVPVIAGHCMIELT
jgi:hypothetical protein